MSGWNCPANDISTLLNCQKSCWGGLLQPQYHISYILEWTDAKHIYSDKQSIIDTNILQLWQSVRCSYLAVPSRLPNQQDLNLARKYLFSHFWRHMLGRMAGHKPVTNRTLSSFFICTNKKDKLATHMHTCKARLNPPLSSSSKYNSWKEECQQTCFAAIT